METFVLVLALTAVVCQALVVILAFFGPGLAYRIIEKPSSSLDSPEFSHVLGLLADSEPHPDTKVEVFTNGNTFYEAELEAIASATSHICLEAYIFQKGEIANR